MPHACYLFSQSFSQFFHVLKSAGSSYVQSCCQPNLLMHILCIHHVYIGLLRCCGAQRMMTLSCLKTEVCGVQARSSHVQVFVMLLSTALEIPAVVQDQPDWQEILTYFRGSELQNYFTRILEDDLHAIIKPQYVDHIPRAVKGNVEDVLKQKDGRGQREHLQEVLELNQVLDRDVEHLSATFAHPMPHPPAASQTS